MTWQFHQDPTKFGGREYYVNERRTDDQRPRKLEIGVATLFAGFCAVSLGVSLFAGSGAVRLAEVAYYAVR